MLINKKLKVDETFTKFKRIVKNATQVDIALLLKEVENLHSGRNIRSLKGKAVSPTRLMNVCAEDTAYRSRLVEINMTFMREYGPLKLAHETIKDYLNSKYGSGLGVRSIADREAVWNSVLLDSRTRMIKLEDAIELTEMVIEDIDKSSFSLKHLLQTLEIISKRE